MYKNNQIDNINVCNSLRFISFIVSIYFCINFVYFVAIFSINLHKSVYFMWYSMSKLSFPFISYLSRIYSSI